MTNRPVIGMDKYLPLLEKLMEEGTGVGHVGEIVAIWGPDGKYFVTEDIQKGLGHLQRMELPETTDPAFQLKKRPYVDVEYMPADASNPNNGHLKPNPGAFRVAIQMQEEITVPVKYDMSGGFTIPAGGFLVVQQKEMAALAQALEDIRQGKKTVDEALCHSDPSTGGKIMKFDIYGIDPTGLGALGFAPVELGDDAKSISARFRQAAFVRSTPFTRRSANFISDHVAPERATFAKRRHGGPAV